MQQGLKSLANFPVIPCSTFLVIPQSQYFSSMHGMMLNFQSFHAVFFTVFFQATAIIRMASGAPALRIRAKLYGQDIFERRRMPTLRMLPTRHYMAWKNNIGKPPAKSRFDPKYQAVNLSDKCRATRLWLLCAADPVGGTCKCTGYKACSSSVADYTSCTHPRAQWHHAETERKDVDPSGQHMPPPL